MPLYITTINPSRLKANLAWGNVDICSLTKQKIFTPPKT